MKYDNNYFLRYLNMNFIYTGSTVGLITGKFLESFLHITQVSLTNCSLPVFYKIKSGINVNTPR